MLLCLIQFSTNVSTVTYNNQCFKQAMSSRITILLVECIAYLYLGVEWVGKRRSEKRPWNGGRRKDENKGGEWISEMSKLGKRIRELGKLVLGF